MRHLLKERINEIKQLNPNFGYGSIAKLVHCTKNTVRYHLDPAQKEAVIKRVAKLRKSQHPLYRKIIGFCTDYGGNKKQTWRRKNKNKMLALQDVLNLIGPNPVCYLTGEPIDILEMSTYSLDHRIPLCKGGESTLDNLGLTTRYANTSKNGMSPQEFFFFCKKVLIHQGYKITDPS